MLVNEAIAADYLVDVPPSFAPGKTFTIDDLQYWAPIKVGQGSSTSQPSAPPSPPGIPWKMKNGTPRAYNWLATLRNWGVPLLLLGIFAALMVNMTSVDAHQILDNGTANAPPPRPVTGGATAPPNPTPWLLYFILGAGYANILYLLIRLFSSPNAQANAVVGNRGTRSLPPPRAKSPPSRYQLQYVNAIDRMGSGPSWLILVYLIEVIIAWYFHRGSRALNIHSQPQVAPFEKADHRGIYWLAPPVAGVTPATVSRARLATLMFQLGSTLLLWQEIGPPTLDQVIRCPPSWTTAIKTATNELLFYLSGGQLLLYLVHMPADFPLPGKLLDASNSAVASPRIRAMPARRLVANTAKWSSQKLQKATETGT